VPQTFDVWCAEEHEQETRDERDPHDEGGADDAGDPRIEVTGVAVGAEEPDELHDHDQRSRGGLGERESVDHLAGLQPAVDLDGALCDVRQHRVSATERHDCGAGEEQPLVDENVVAAEQHNRDGGSFAVQGAIRDQRCRAKVGIIVNPGGEQVGSRAASQVAGEPSHGDHDRERDVEHEQRSERSNGDADQEPVLERAPSDPPQRLRNDREHRGAEPGEDRRDCCGRPPFRVDRRQDHQRHVAGKHEQDPRDEAAGSAVQQPAEVDRELLRFWTGQQGAIRQRVQEPLLADPASFVDEFAMHDRDLPGGPAKGAQGDPEPRARRFTEGNDVACLRERWDINTASIRVGPGGETQTALLDVAHRSNGGRPRRWPLRRGRRATSPPVPSQS